MILLFITLGVLAAALVFFPVMLAYDVYKEGLVLKAEVMEAIKLRPTVELIALFAVVPKKYCKYIRREIKRRSKLLDDEVPGMLRGLSEFRSQTRPKGTDGANAS
jgi:hypothetical protein